MYRNSYDHIDMHYYALSFSNARFLMNSSRTRSHIASTLSHEHFGSAVWCAHILKLPLMFVWCAPSARAIWNIMDGLSCCGRTDARRHAAGDRRATHARWSFSAWRQRPGHSQHCTVSVHHSLSRSFIRALTQLVAVLRRTTGRSFDPLHSFYLMDYPEYQSMVRLVLLGGARNKDDLERVRSQYQHRFATSGDRGARRRLTIRRENSSSSATLQRPVKSSRKDG